MIARRSSIRLPVVALLLPVLASGCGGESAPSRDLLEGLAPRDQVDALAAQISEGIQNLEPVVTIDHARLAEAEGVSMPPSIVTIYSDREVNTALIATDPLIGLDLPHRVLAFAEAGADTASVAYADAEFLAKRHGLSDAGLLEGYTRSLETALEGIPERRKAPSDTSRLEERYGIIEIDSDYPFEDTIERLRAAVLAQSDTKWFGEVDYHADAAGLGLEVPKATLLLFGGPEPGGRAMADFPKLGLDAFCQKLLVYESADGEVRVAFNDIAAFAELHYGTTLPLHHALNGRLTETFRAAVRAPGDRD